MRCSISKIAVGVLCLVAGVAYAQDTTTTTVVEKKVITTPAPKSANCKTVSAHWEGNEWVSEQTVCKYENRAEGVAWIESYWACTVYTADGTCSTWTLKPGHWATSIP